MGGQPLPKGANKHGTKTLSKWLKFVIIGVGICALFIFLYLLPSYGLTAKEIAPEYAFAFWPWLIFLWIAAIPCFAALVLCWMIATNIARDKSFSQENSNHLRWIARLGAGDSAFFFVGNIVLLLCGMSHPGIVLIAMVVVFAGITITVAAACLSHLVKKAASLQEQSDLTI